MIWSITLEGKNDLGRFRDLQWGIRSRDDWKWTDCDKRFGDEWPGRIPAQLIAHILYYFSNPGDLAIDPMAGGGVVSHPSQWSFCGYNEIQGPRRKNILINYDRLQSLFGAGSYEQLMRSHEGWVNEYLGDGKNGCEEEWTGSIAVGNRTFAEKVKELLGFRAKGRKIIRVRKDTRSGKLLLPITCFLVSKTRIQDKKTPIWGKCQYRQNPQIA